MSSFPDNILSELKQAFTEHMSDHTVVTRPVRASDPAKTIGIFLADSAPDERSSEIGKLEPTITRYNIRIQNLIQHTEEEVGRAMFAVSAKSIKVILYRDANLHVRLRGLNEELLGTRERVLKFGLTRQRYVNNELQGNWFFVATTEFWVETDVEEV